MLVDIDGTVALIGDRSPYDMSRSAEDEPNHAVIAAVRAMHAAGYGVVYCTGRDTPRRAATERGWTGTSACRTWRCTCAGIGDSRQDAVVKRDIFHRRDPRPVPRRRRLRRPAQVVRMWRALGLTVFQVAEGDF